MSIRRERARRLRLAVAALPYDTRVAMLEGIRSSDEIIAGAYAGRRGGVCPLLAAHRAGGRSSQRGFARAWDRFTGVRTRPRRATEREVGVLAALLEQSVAAGPAVDLAAAAAEVRAARAERGRRDTGERDRTAELSGHTGWAWLRAYRRYDEYEAALRHVHGEAGQGPGDSNGNRTNGNASGGHANGHAHGGAGNGRRASRRERERVRG